MTDLTKSGIWGKMDRMRGYESKGVRYGELRWSLLGVVPQEEGCCVLSRVVGAPLIGGSHDLSWVRVRGPLMHLSFPRLL